MIETFGFRRGKESKKVRKYIAVGERPRVRPGRGFDRNNEAGGTIFNLGPIGPLAGGGDGGRLH